MTFDAVIRGGWLTDPAHGRDGLHDIAVTEGRVAAFGEPGTLEAPSVLDATGRRVVPGLVDTHVHVPGGAGTAGHRMLAAAGVTTALDLMGPIDDVLALAATHGAGLTVGCVDTLAPGRTLPRPDAGRADVEAAIDRALAAGALGVKLHVDHALTPAAAALALDCALERHAWLAWHVGTTATASDLTGAREALEIAGDRPFHLAHANSYCRGDVAGPAEEAQELLEALRRHPRVFAESYLSAVNGAWGACADGVPEAPRVRAWLVRGGFAPTEDGLERALDAGYARAWAAGPGGSSSWPPARPESRRGGRPGRASASRCRSTRSRRGRCWPRRAGRTAASTCRRWPRTAARSRATSRCAPAPRSSASTP